MSKTTGFVILPTHNAASFPDTDFTDDYELPSTYFTPPRNGVNLAAPIPITALLFLAMKHSPNKAGDQRDGRQEVVEMNAKAESLGSLRAA